VVGRAPGRIPAKKPAEKAPQSFIRRRALSTVFRRSSRKRPGPPQRYPCPLTWSSPSSRLIPVQPRATRDRPRGDHPAIVGPWKRSLGGRNDGAGAAV
jgi:hypothetical protein